MKTTKITTILALCLPLLLNSHALAQLPTGWHYINIGNPGGWSYDVSTQKWTLHSGVIPSDSVHVYKKINVDCEIIARIVSGPGSGIATIGIRENLTDSSKYVELSISEFLGGILRYNSDTGGSSIQTYDNDFPIIDKSICFPYWVRLERKGDRFTGYMSPDGIDWELVGSVDILMNKSINIGMSVEKWETTGIGQSRGGAWAGFDNVRVFVIPNDEYYNHQWHLNNTGQGGRKPEADADVQEAWHLTTGSSEIVIAVLDDGIETSHPDLSPNLFYNTGEIPGNGLDDDENGYIDDVCGWDFYDWDNDPNPDEDSEKHGTAVAGVAVARGNNSIGVAGVAYECQLLPIRVGENQDGEFYSTPERIAEAIQYAAGLDENGVQIWRGADIICITFSLYNMSDHLKIDEALNWAATNGRAGLGCPIFVTSGTVRNGYINVNTPSLTGALSGWWSWVISYEKDSRTTAGEDTVCIGELTNADGIIYRFDSMELSGDWGWPHGEKKWYVEDNPAHAYGTSRYQIRAEAIGHNERAVITVPKFYVGNDTIPSINLKLWRSCDVSDTVNFYVYSYDTSTLYSQVYHSVEGSVQGTQDVWYPSNHEATISVGASTNFGFRSHKSPYGPGLDFLAPSDGGTLGIYTTDRTGLDGYSDGDYYSDFGGTSAACPFAAGVAALILSKNPNLTRDEVLSIMCDSCDQIGEVEYPDGWNEYYGYGQINAYKALLSLSEIDIDSSQ